MGSRDLARKLAEESVQYHQRFASDLAPTVAALADMVTAALARGGKILLFGNGGSASQAQHLAAEFVNRFERDRPALAAIALTCDGAALTSIANDDRYDRVFARQVEALGRPGDVAIGLTTTGASPSIVLGLRVARERGLLAIAFSGRDGGAAAREVEHALVIPGASTARIQELHLLAGHILCALVDERLFPQPVSGCEPEEE